VLGWGRVKVKTVEANIAQAPHSFECGWYVKLVQLIQLADGGIKSCDVQLVL